MAGGSKSKNKGNSGERELCKLLGEIFGGSFIRSANSGAFVGGKNAFRKATLSENQVRATKSDIVPPDFMPRLVVESKFYQTFDYHRFLDIGPIPLLDGWIRQTMESADDGDFWLLAFKANRRPWAAVFPDAHAAKFDLAAGHVRYVDGQGRGFIVVNLAAFATRNRDAVIALSQEQACTP